MAKDNNMVNYLTVKQLYDACQKNKYLLLRFASGYQMGVNCKAAKIAQRLNPKEWDKKTEFVSYQPCGMEEYIQHKHPFLNTRIPRSQTPSSKLYEGTQN